MLVVPMNTKSHSVGRTSLEVVPMNTISHSVGRTSLEVVPKDIFALCKSYGNYGNYTLSDRAFQTLELFLIKSRYIDEKTKYYKLSGVDGAYYEWAKKYELLGYEHIVTKVCAPYVPFFPNQCHSCIWCLDGPTCQESTMYTYIWFWKPILLTDIWEEQEKLIPKEWEINICAMNQQGNRNRIYTLYQDKLEFLHERSTVLFKMRKNNIHLVFTLVNVTKNNIRIKISYLKGNKEREILVPRDNTKVHLFAHFYLFGTDL